MAAKPALRPRPGQRRACPWKLIHHKPQDFPCQGQKQPTLSPNPHSRPPRKTHIPSLTFPNLLSPLPCEQTLPSLVRTTRCIHPYVRTFAHRYIHTYPSAPWAIGAAAPPFSSFPCLDHLLLCSSPCLLPPPRPFPSQRRASSRLNKYMYY